MSSSSNSRGTATASPNSKKYGKLSDAEEGRRALLAPELPAYSASHAHEEAPPAYSPFPEDEKFDESPRYSDVWASVLFVLHLIAFFAVVGITVPALDFSGGENGGKAIPAGTFTVLLVAVGAGAVASLGYFYLMMNMAKTLITTGFTLNILYNFGIAIAFFANGAYAAGGLWMFLAVVFGFIWWSWRGRIPFATIMLESVTSILGQFPGTTVAAVAGLAVNVAWLALWIVTLFGVIVKYSPSTSQEALTVLLIFLAFSFYWTSQVISNVVHVTISGTVATYYFLGTSDVSGKVTVPVSNPTAASFKRAVTTSFGPIAFGSLLVSLLEVLRGLVNAGQQQAARDDNALLAFCLMCLRALLDIVDDLFRYFNRYAYATVAVYGKSFCESAKTTWNMVKQRGVDAIINDALISSVLGIGSVFIGFLVASITVFATSYMPHLGQDWCTFLNADGDAQSCQLAVSSISGILAFFIGVVEFAVVSGVSSRMVWWNTSGMTRSDVSQTVSTHRQSNLLPQPPLFASPKIRRRCSARNPSCTQRLPRRTLLLACTNKGGGGNRSSFIFSCAESAICHH